MPIEAETILLILFIILFPIWVIAITNILK